MIGFTIILAIFAINDNEDSFDDAHQVTVALTAPLIINIKSEQH